MNGVSEWVPWAILKDGCSLYLLLDREGTKACDPIEFFVVTTDTSGMQLQRRSPRLFIRAVCTCHFPSPLKISDLAKIKCLILLFSSFYFFFSSPSFFFGTEEQIAFAWKEEEKILALMELKNVFVTVDFLLSLRIIV